MLWQRTLGDESEATKFRRPRRRISSARWELRIRNTLRWKSLKIKCLCIFGWVIEMKIIKLKEFPFSWKNINHLFHLSNQITDGDRFLCFCFLTALELIRISSLEELIVWTEKQIQKLLIYFELKRYFSLKNISYPLNIDYFI